MSTDPKPAKPRLRAPAIWRQRDCQCRQRALLCFGLPLLPPAVTLVAVAYGTNLPFGVFHVLAFILTGVSVACILLAIAITVYRKYLSPKDTKKISEGREEEDPPVTARSRGSVQRSSGGSVELVKVTNGLHSSVATENEVKAKPRKRKTGKRKHRKQKTKLAPVKEEDGRARFEKTMEERDRTYVKSHKRTKSETTRWFDKHDDELPVVQTLTKEHLRLLDLFNNQENPQLKRCRSMSDLGDSASERIVTDFPESSMHRKRFSPRPGRLLVTKDPTSWAVVQPAPSSSTPQHRGPASVRPDSLPYSNFR